jgi:predicted transcriptional regulator
MKEVAMSIPGVPREGFKTVGQIEGTDVLLFRAGQDAVAIALDLVGTHTSGAPVLDSRGKFIGFISEIDVLEAIESGKDLSKLTAEDIMSRSPVAVHESTPISEAVKIMKDKHLLNLPVEQNGKVAYSVTRHDLLRARVGLGPDIEG